MRRLYGNGEVRSTASKAAGGRLTVRIGFASVRRPHLGPVVPRILPGLDDPAGLGVGVDVSRCQGGGLREPNPGVDPPRGVDVSDHGCIDHLLVGLQDVNDPVFALKSSVLLVLRRKFIAISFDNRPE